MTNKVSVNFEALMSQAADKMAELQDENRALKARAEAAEQDVQMWHERAMEATRQPSDGAIYAAVSQRYERDDILQTLFEAAEALESRLTDDEFGSEERKPYEHPLSVLERARAILEAPHMPDRETNDAPSAPR